MSTLITGLFHSRTEAEQAVDALTQIGVARDDISIMMSEQTRAAHFSDGATSGHADATGGTKIAEGAGTGAAVGGTLGAIAGMLTLAAGNLFLPGVGLLATGALLAGLAGAGAGGVAGTLVGGLIGMGIPKEHAEHLEAGLQSGGILVGVHAADASVEAARRVLNAQGAENTQTYAENATPPSS